jgi:hypothetical protein
VVRDDRDRRAAAGRHRLRPKAAKNVALDVVLSSVGGAR